MATKARVYGVATRFFAPLEPAGFIPEFGDLVEEPSGQPEWPDEATLSWSADGNVLWRNTGHRGDLAELDFCLLSILSTTGSTTLG